MSNEEPNVNPQDGGEIVSRSCQRSSRKPLPSQAQRPRRKKWFHGPDPWSLCSVQPRDLVLCVQATLAITERGQHRARTVASEGASPEPWQLPRGVEPVSAQKSRIGFRESLPSFQKMCGNAWMHRQKFAAGAGLSWRTSARAVCKGNVGSEPRAPAGTLPSGAVSRGPLSSRPQNGRSTDSLHCVPRRAADTQHQPVKAAGREAAPCRATGAELPKTMGTHPA
ncbi:uncharacterized protein [Macaca nemestrina]|uniref:uncharacterized protein n=1 Tax=Macaca nemestrina TaxID=9545 RepID=UPI0039B9A7C8